MIFAFTRLIEKLLSSVLKLRSGRGILGYVSRGRTAIFTKSILPRDEVQDQAECLVGIQIFPLIMCASRRIHSLTL